ncbi:hypothetical protein SK128_015146 [Halocaridina rubra]|uniref:Chloride channel CLIC-like protein 1 n=1 Tax=Halocaridina rubra TaxID=373956 RepID=A0AAN9A655_HALRR
MLNYHGQKNQPKEVLQNTMFDSKFTIREKDACNFEVLKLEEERKKLGHCQEQVMELKQAIESDKQKLKAMEKKLMSEGTVDISAFYRRSVLHLWNTLALEGVKLQDSDSALIKHLIVRVSSDDLKTLQDYINNQNNVQQVDEFLQYAFQLEDLPEHDRFIWIGHAMDYAKNVEVWLYALCIAFLLLGVWASYLFIQDIQRELRWTRVIMMMIVLTFLICCLWHWRHMHKVAASRRHAQMMKKGFTNIPEECKPGGQVSSGIWEWFKVRVIGTPDVCERYYEDLMIDPTEEITPGMVIAETLAKFFLQPLQHLGSESAKFITNFYQTVPIGYHIHATVFFVVLLIIILFAFCGYGIDFPFWMGGIRPIYRTETADTSEVERIRNEAISQLQADRDAFLTESHKMLSDIAKAASSSQVQTGMQPLMMMSSGIIQSQLELLIARKFSNIISCNSNLGTSLEHSHPEPSAVQIVSSTPLRRPCTPQKKDCGSLAKEDVRDGGAEDFEKTEDYESVSVATDAAHYRLVGSPRKNDLKPQSQSDRTASTSTLTGSGRKNDLTPQSQGDRVVSTRTNTPGYVNPRQRTEDVKMALSEDINTTSVRRRPMRKISNDSQTLYSENASQSLNVRRIGKTSEDNESDSRNFLVKVQSILEDSSNSGVCQGSDGDESSSKVSCTSLNESQTEDEIELSTAGAKFLGKIRKVMTP